MSFPAAGLDALRSALLDLGEVVVACSGGPNSLTLAAAAHRFLGARARIIHIAGDPDSSRRVRAAAARQAWDLTVVAADEATRTPAGSIAIIARMSDAAMCAGPAYAEAQAGHAADLRSLGAITPLFDLRVDAVGVDDIARALDLSVA